MSKLEDNVISKLNSMSSRLDEITEMLTYPEVLADIGLVSRLSSENSMLQPLVAMYKTYLDVSKDIDYYSTNIAAFTSDEKAAALEELDLLKLKLENISSDIMLALTTRESEESQVCIMLSPRANDISKEFAGDLESMYINWARINGLVEDEESSQKAGLSALILKGKNANKIFARESGLHEAVMDSGVAEVKVVVFDMPDKVNIELRDEDIRVDIYRSSGAGGQNINKVSTAVRMTHIPTKIVVTCQDERSQFQNRDKARAALVERVNEFYNNQFKKELETRREQTSKSSTKRVRKYYYIQNKVMDIATKLEMALDEFYSGDIKVYFNKIL